jgi:hypothetical protein
VAAEAWKRNSTQVCRELRGEPMLIMVNVVNGKWSRMTCSDQAFARSRHPIKLYSTVENGLNVGGGHQVKLITLLLVGPSADMMRSGVLGRCGERLSA